MKNVIVGQSGGPTAVINSSLYGVVTAARACPDIDRVYGMRNGVEGFLKDHLVDLTSVSEEELEKLRITPGAYLGSCRYKLPQDETDPVYPRIFEQLESHDVAAFLYVGGNDSMDTVSKLSAYGEKIGSPIRFIGIPKTIDNDLVLTDHTPGFASAAKFVASTVREINRDASVYDRKTVTIIEIMGRNAGWLTATSALARRQKLDNPVLIYLPEVCFDSERFLSHVEEALTRRNNVTVCVSEGIHDEKGFLCERTGEMQVDNFGHKLMNGCGKYLENLVRNRLGIKARSVELNVTQRCSSAYLSATDWKEAAMAGSYGVKAAMAGESCCMVAFEREPEADYAIHCHTVPVSLVCNKEKTFPLEWITPEENDVTDDFARYALPLIQGEVSIPRKDGLPDFACLDDVTQRNN